MKFSMLTNQIKNMKNFLIITIIIHSDYHLP